MYLGIARISLLFKKRALPRILSENLHDTTLCSNKKEAHNMLYIVNFNIKEHKSTEFQKFIKETEKTMAILGFQFL